MCRTFWEAGSAKIRTKGSFHRNQTGTLRGRPSGRGAAIAVVGRGDDPAAAKDLAAFAAAHGEPLRPGQFRQILPPGLAASCQAIQGRPNEAFNEEETQDIETVHGLAPGAQIFYLGGACDDDGEALPLLDALTQVTDRHLAGIVSDSWVFRYAQATPSPGLAAAYEQVFEQGAAEGTGFCFGSGDTGDNSVLPRASGRRSSTRPATRG